MQLGDYERLLRLYKKVAQDVQSGSSYAKVAATLAQMDRKEEALEVAEEVVRINPDLKPDVDDFIEKVKSGENYNFVGE